MRKYIVQKVKADDYGIERVTADIIWKDEETDVRGFVCEVGLWESNFVKRRARKLCKLLNDNKELEI